MSTFNTHGGYFAPKDYARVDTGGSHEENPNGGVQLGVDPQGIPNLLEEGEPVYKDYVFSDNIKAKKEFLVQNKLSGSYTGKLYSEIADLIVDEAEERPFDPISRSGLEAMLSRLAQAQEMQKQAEQMEELEAALSKLSPEELDALEQQLAMEEQQDAEQGMAVPQEGAVPQQGMAVDPMMQGQPMIQGQVVPDQIQQVPMMRNGGFLKQFDGGGNIDGEVTKVLPFSYNPELGMYENNTPYHAQAVIETPAVVTAQHPFSENVSKGISDFGTDVFNLGKELSYYTPAGPAVHLVESGLNYATGNKKGATQHAVSALEDAALMAAGSGIVKGAKNIMSKADLGKLFLKEHGFSFEYAGSMVNKYKDTIDELGKRLDNIKADIKNYKEGSGISKDVLELNRIQLKKDLKLAKTEYARYKKSYDSAKKQFDAAEQFEKTATKSSNAPDSPKSHDASSPSPSPSPEAPVSPDVPTSSGTAPQTNPTGKSAGSEAMKHIPFHHYLWDPTAVWRSGYNYKTTGRKVAAGLLHDAAVAAVYSSPIWVPKYIKPIIETNSSRKQTYETTGAFESMNLKKNGGPINTAGQVRIFDGGTPGTLVQPGQYKFPGWGKLIREANGNVGIEDAVYNWTGWSRPHTYYPYHYGVGTEDVAGTGIGVAGTGTGTGNSSKSQSATNDFTNYSLAISPKATGIMNRALESQLPTNYTDLVNKKELRGNRPITRFAPDIEESSDDLSTAGRYAKARGAAALGLYNAFTPADEYTLGRVLPYSPYANIHLQNQRYAAVDPNMISNQQLAQANSTARAIANSTNPSSAAALLALDNNTTRNLGTGFLQGVQANNQQRNAVIAANNQAEAQRAQFDYGVDYARARALQQAQMQNLQNDLTLQRLNYGAESDKYAAISNQINAGLDALAGIGQENFAMNQINSNRALNGYNTTTTGTSRYNPDYYTWLDKNYQNFLNWQKEEEMKKKNKKASPDTDKKQTT